MKKISRIIIPEGMNPPQMHELITASVFTNNGMDVEFIRPSILKGSRSADVIINNIAWEIKSPTGAGKNTIQEQLKRALKQSNYIILDSARTKLTDQFIVKELRRNLLLAKSIKRLLLVNKKREIIEIRRY